MRTKTTRYLVGRLLLVVVAGALVAVGLVLREGTPATKARVLANSTATSTDLTPNGLAVDSNGDVYIADAANHVVREITALGAVSVVAGIPGQTGRPTPGPATSSDLGNPSGLAINSVNDLYISDPANSVVEEVTPSGVLSIVTGVPGQSGVPTPGAATRSYLSLPEGLALDANGNLYVAASLNSVVEEVNTSQVASTVAGYADTGGPPNCSLTLGLGVRCTPAPATSSYLFFPQAVAVDSSGDVFIADTGNNVVEEINSSTGYLSVIAGTPDQAGVPSPGTATFTDLGTVTGLALYGGNLYIADSSNNLIEEVNLASDQLSIVAGVPGQSGPPSGGPAASSDLNSPGGVAVDGQGNLYISDSDNNLVEKVTPPGVLSILAGTGTGIPCPFTSPLTTTAPGNYTVPPFAVCTIGKGGNLGGNVTVSGGMLDLQAGGTVQGNVTVVDTLSQNGVLNTSGGTIKGNVQSQAAATLGAGTTVTGNVQATAGTLSDQGATVDGNVQTQGATSLVVTGGSVDGNVQTQGATAVALTGGATVKGSVTIQATTSVPASPVAACPSTNGSAVTYDVIGNVTINGNLQVQNNGSQARFDIADCAGQVNVGGSVGVQNNAGAQILGGSAGATVHGSVLVQNNTGGGTLADNHAGGSCQLQGDQPPFTAVPDNTVGSGQQNSCDADG